MDDLYRFFSSADHFDVLETVNGRNTPLSLRNIATFVPIHADVGVRDGYRKALAELGRKRFDPFRRGDRVRVVAGDRSIDSTEAQMTFFKWMIETGLWSFMVQNASLVHTVCAHHAKTTPPPVTRRSRHRPRVEISGGGHILVFD